MNRKGYLINQFIDDAENHDFECSPLFNMDDEEEIFSVEICDENQAPIIKVHFDRDVKIETFAYYSEFRENQRERNKWLVNRVNTLLLDLEDAQQLEDLDE